MIVKKRSDFSSTLEIQLQNIHDDTDNKMLIENLRELANALENENPKILNFGIIFSSAHKIPILILEIDE